jgi:general secretion pathway protein G
MASHTATGKHRPIEPGFTLIELLVVMAIIATLLSIAVPRYFGSTEDAREAALKSDLRTVREAIDHYHADRGSYPDILEDLVEKRYLRAIPVDPITGDINTWILLPPPKSGNTSTTTASGTSTVAPTGIYDIRSGATGSTRDGQPFQNL